MGRLVRGIEYAIYPGEEFEQGAVAGVVAEVAAQHLVHGGLDQQRVARRVYPHAGQRVPAGLAPALGCAVDQVVQDDERGLHLRGKRAVVSLLTPVESFGLQLYCVPAERTH